MMTLRQQRLNAGGRREHLQELREQDPAAGAAGTRHRRGDPRGKDGSGLMLEQLERPLPASWAEQRARILEPKTS